MNEARIKELIKVYRDGLLEDTLTFWQRYSPDREQGGFLTFLDADGTVFGTDKPMWIQGRITWLFSRLYNEVEQREEWLELAKHGFDFLCKHGFDTDGRMFYSLTKEGRPLRKRRYLFTEAFGVIALAEYARATGDAEALQRARDLFSLTLHYHQIPGLLEPKVNPQARSSKSHAMPMILLATTQVLRRCDEDPLYQQVADAAVHEVLDDFVKPDLKVLLEAVGPNGEFLDEPAGREVNPGHAIETSWFLMEEARLRNGDEELIQQACQILLWSLEIGWDQEFGGLYYFRDCKGLPCSQYEHDMKLWWPHTEAIYATLLAYHLTGDTDFLMWHQKLHNWAYSHFPDQEHGEWFGYLHRDGSLSTPLKGNMWKGPFHLPRMQINCWKLLESML